MKFLLNLGFMSGRQLAPARIMASEPAVGELIIEAWPPQGIKRFSRFRRVAIFTQADVAEQFRLYDPEVTRVTPTYMELTGHEQDSDTFRTQSWILRPVPPSCATGFDPRDDDSGY